MTETLLKIDGLSHAYDAQTVLQLDSWEVKAGERWLLTGPSGSGKSTLLNLIAGLNKIQRGSVQVLGQALETLSENQRDKLRAKSFGIVLQTFHLLPSLTVLQNLTLAQYLAGHKVDPSRAIELLASVDLEQKADARPHQLSVGQAQRVAIARAVVNQPDLIIADEPTSALDTGNAKDVLDLLFQQAENANAALIVATHDLRFAESIPNHLDLGERS